MTPAEKELEDLNNTTHTMSDKFADAYQQWTGMSGVVAFYLIDCHADGWGDISAMMDAWLRANGGKVV